MTSSEPVSIRRRALLSAPPHKTPAAARYLIHRPLPVQDLTELFAPGPVPGRGYLATVDDLYVRCLENAADIDRMQEVMLATFLSENIVCFADSMAMDSSAELRMPFLDRDLVHFVLSLPPHMRVSRWPGRANTKLILRWWGEDHLPRDVIRRRKRAFPFGNLPAMLREHGDELRSHVLDCEPLTRELPGVGKWLGHAPEYFRGPWEGTLWALLSLGIWCRHAGVR